MSNAEDLADAVVSFVRCFGLHRPERTSCGFDAGVAEAHSLIELERGPMRQMELVSLLGLSKSTVSRLVSGMVDRGWVVRGVSEDDGRGVVLSLSAEGVDAAASLSRARSKRMEALLDQVPQDKREEVVGILRVLQEAAQATDVGK